MSKPFKNVLNFQGVPFQQLLNQKLRTTILLTKSKNKDTVSAMIFQGVPFQQLLNQKLRTTILLTKSKNKNTVTAMIPFYFIFFVFVR
jgi:hypothetical protein